MSGCDKFFLCLAPAMENSDIGRRRAVNIAKIAKATGVKQAVVSSSIGVSMGDRKEPFKPGSFLELFPSVKKGVEQAVVDAGFESWTVLRPSLFMANFLEPKINNPMYGEVQDRGTMDASRDGLILSLRKSTTRALPSLRLRRFRTWISFMAELSV